MCKLWSNNKIPIVLARCVRLFERNISRREFEYHSSLFYLRSVSSRSFCCVFSLVFARSKREVQINSKFYLHIWFCFTRDSFFSLLLIPLSIFIEREKNDRKKQKDRKKCRKEFVLKRHDIITYSRTLSMICFFFHLLFFFSAIDREWVIEKIVSYLQNFYLIIYFEQRKKNVYVRVRVNVSNTFHRYNQSNQIRGLSWKHTMSYY